MTAKAYQMRLSVQDIYRLNSVGCFQQKVAKGVIGGQSYAAIPRLPNQADTRSS